MRASSIYALFFNKVAIIKHKRNVILKCAEFSQSKKMYMYMFVS